MKIGKAQVWVDPLSVHKIKSFSYVWFLCDTQCGSKWNADPSGNFLCGNSSCHIRCGSLSSDRDCLGASHTYQPGPSSLEAEVKDQPNEHKPVVFLTKLVLQLAGSYRHRYDHPGWACDPSLCWHAVEKDKVEFATGKPCRKLGGLLTVARKNWPGVHVN